MKKNKYKGIILAGGTGSRLFPLTKCISKQLLPVFDKPMIYYPLSLLFEIGIYDIAIIVKKEDKNSFKKLLGDGAQWNCKISYIEQNKPNGIAESYKIAKNFLNNSPSVLVLGDNIFYGSEIFKKMTSIKDIAGGHIIAVKVKNASNYGNLKFKAGKLIKIVEKPKKQFSEYAVTGIYYLDNNASKLVNKIKYSKRGELEITDLLNLYLEEKKLNYSLIDEHSVWFDAGTHESLNNASNFVKSLQERNGSLFGSPDEIAYKNNWISKNQLKSLRKIYKNEYGELLDNL